MKLFSTRIRLTLLAVAVFGAGLVSVIEFSGWQAIEAVTLDGDQIANPRRKLGLDSEASVLKQPLESTAKLLLLSDRTARVDIDVDLPSSLHIYTNRFSPVCLVLDRVGGHLLGLNHDGRTVPLRQDYKDWERPVITGVEAGRVFERCEDPRVTLIVPQLKQLSEENPKLYRLIEEIDLDSPWYVTVTVAGLAYRFRVTADGLLDQITSFFSFVETYQTSVDSSETVDLRFTNLIVQQLPVDTLVSKSGTREPGKGKNGR